MESSIVTRKGQVTIPARIRRRLGLEEGDLVAFVDDGERVVILRAENDVSAAFGILKATKSASLEDIDAAVRRRGSSR